jgi:hypothetical protein
VGQAWVRCLRRGLYNTPTGGSSVLSDQQGRFTVTCGLGSGFKLVATHRDYQRSVTGWLEGPPANLELKRGVRLQGKVLDRDGKPAAGATVSLSIPDQMIRLHEWDETRVKLPGRTQAGPQGEFDFEPVQGELLVVAEGTDGTRAELRVSLEGEGERSVELKLEEGPHVAGVVTLDGQPAPGVIVGWRCGGRDLLQPTSHTDSTGAFRLHQLAGSEHCFVVAQPEAGDRFLGTQVAARPGDENLRLALMVATPGSLKIGFSGAFPDYSGDFTLTPSDGNNPVRKKPEYFPQPTVTMTGLPPGRYRLSAKLYDGKSPAPVEIDISSNVETSATLVVPDGFARGQATGRVVDAQTGQPLAGAGAAFEDGRGVLMGKTAADGTFRYPYAAERVALTVERAGYERRRIELAVGSGQSAQLGDILLKKN